MSLSKSSPDIFKVIADPTRRAILDALQDRPLSVTEICGQFSLTQGAVSQHLKILRDVDLVTVTKAGRQRLYSADPLPLLEVFEWLLHYRRFWPKRLDALGDYLDSMKDDE
jgi:DNA-binding transcriptional ArsR family regulator